MSSVAESPNVYPFADVDPADVYAYELALKMHEARWRAIPRVIALPTPAAGSEWSTAVPEGTTWFVQTAGCTLGASAVVANRTTSLTVSDGTTIFGRFTQVGSATASQSIRLVWAANYGNRETASSFLGWVTAWPMVPLFGGVTVATVTSGLDAGDQYSAAYLYVIEIRERQLAERAAHMRELVTGAHADLYPGLLLGL